MKNYFQSNSKVYCFTNIVACVLCMSCLCTNYYSVDNNSEESLIIDSDTEPLSAINENVLKESNKDNKVKTVITRVKANTSSKKYIRPNYNAVTGNAVVDYAKNYLGLRYVSGGNSLTTGTDCSGFTKLIYQQFGISLSRSVKVQSGEGKYVRRSDLQKGDLIFYGQRAGVVSHVAIYIGGGQVIHQSTPQYGVKINTMNMMVYITARRVITEKSNNLKPNETKPLPDVNEKVEDDLYTQGEYQENNKQPELNKEPDNSLDNILPEENKEQDNSLDNILPEENKKPDKDLNEKPLEDESLEESKDNIQENESSNSSLNEVVENNNVSQLVNEKK